MGMAVESRREGELFMIFMKGEVMNKAWMAGWGAVLLLAGSAAAEPVGGKGWAKRSDLAFITNQDSSDVAVLDLNTQRVVGKMTLPAWSGPHMSMMTHDGTKLVAVGTKRNSVFVYDLASGEERGRAELGLACEHFDITHDSRYACIGNMDSGELSIVDLDEVKEVARIGGFFEPHGITVHPDNKRVYVGNFGAHEVVVVDLDRRAVAKRLAVGEAFRLASTDPEALLADIRGVANVTLTPDGRFAYAAVGDAGQVAVIDTAQDRVVGHVRVGSEPWRAYASPDGRYMLVPNLGDGTVSVISTKNHAVVSTLEAGGEMTGINFSPDGRKAYVISSDEASIFIFDMESFRLLGRPKLGKQIRLETASTSPDGKIALACSTQNAVYLIDTRDDSISEVANVGFFPWAVAIWQSLDNYCH
jgi:YVTN family beta-propeller protein